jgi:hypothetical protein
MGGFNETKKVVIASRIACKNIYKVRNSALLSLSLCTFCLSLPTTDASPLEY